MFRSLRMRPAALTALIPALGLMACFLMLPSTVMASAQIIQAKAVSASPPPETPGRRLLRLWAFGATR